MIEDENITIEDEFDEYYGETIFQFPEIKEDDGIDKNINDVDEMIIEIRKMRMLLEETKPITEPEEVQEQEQTTPSLIKNKQKLKEIPHKIIYNPKEYNLDIQLNKQKNREFINIQDRLYEQEKKINNVSQGVILHDERTNRMFNLIHKTDAELDDLDHEIDDLIKLGEEINNYIEKIV
jgi:hypothetical protein